MITHQSIDKGPSKLGSVVRMLFALAGGAVFATFAWETPEDDDPLLLQSRSQTVDRARGGPTVELQADALNRPGEWGAGQGLAKKQDYAELNSSGPDVDAVRDGSLVRDDQALPGTSVAAGMPHSRSPPEGDAP
jgi:hypothetical protein